MEPEVEVIETNGEGSGIGTGAAMLIGAGLTLATTAVVKLVKRVIAKHKAKKESDLADEHEFVEPSDEEIEAVVAK